MREEQRARRALRAAREAHRLHVEGREPGLAEARGEDDQSSPPLLLPAAGERRQRLALDRCRLGRRLELGRFDLAGRRPQVGPASALGVGRHPLRGERRGRVPEAREGVDDAGVGRRILDAIGAQVPLDAVGERAPGDVAAPDVGHAQARAVEAPRLRVERSRPPRQAIDLDDARLERAGGWLLLLEPDPRLATGPVEQTLERLDVRDPEVVAREEPDPRATSERAEQRLLEGVKPRELDEGRDDRDLVGPREERAKVPQERVPLATRHERPRVLRRRLPVAAARDHVPHAAPRVRHVAPEPRDHVDVQVEHRLAGGGARVEADVVALGPQLGVELPLDLVDQVEDRDLLLACGLEPVAHEPARHHQGVATRHRIGVADGERELVRRDPGRARQVEEAERHGPSQPFGLAAGPGRGSIVMVPSSWEIRNQPR